MIHLADSPNDDDDLSDVAKALIELTIKLRSGTGMMSYAENQAMHDKMSDGVARSMLPHLRVIERWIRSMSGTR